MIEQWVDYLRSTLIGSQAALRWISYRTGFMNEHVIPGLIPVGLGIVGLIPVLISPAHGVISHHDTPVTITHMTYEITGRKLGSCIARKT